MASTTDLCVRIPPKFSLPTQAPIPWTSVSFYHPYHQIALFRFRRTDKKGDEYGVHFLMALTACRILADNAFDGFLTTDQAGEKRVDLKPDQILCDMIYYFHVGKDEEGKTINYAVVPSFNSWTFPSQLPEAWNLPLNINVTRSERCLITGRSTTEKAQCIPAAEEAWFNGNAMGHYEGGSLGNINSISNHFYLHCALHRLFDNRVWTFVPRHGEFAVTALSPRLNEPSGEFSEFVYTFHGKGVMFDFPAPPQFVFARFAWSVLLFAKSFVISGTKVPKLLKTYDPVTETSITKTWRAAEADMKFGGGGSQQSTSRKAKKRVRDEVDDDGVSYMDSEDDKDAGDSEDEMTRGRSRKIRPPAGVRESEWGWVWPMVRELVPRVQARPRYPRVFHGSLL
jgi:HNH endonuclease